MSGCGSCGGSAGPVQKYELVTENGDKRTFLTETEARIALAQTGGSGTINTVR
ncbi:hypothetical protein PQD13_gp43 [Gordonia phage Clawz]|uniref:Uncharacterized protein n=1 Tax=Gordonia phage Clawz TaxID=2743910 RepID=A0AAE7K671_9CAUD|nr:hypothetical protein PQD13_gp43 [Gordonia phage Clawz]QKY79955.1 hypothetical protein SEA_CLAWZ_43 [Gordonia phage Clawz]